MVRNWHRVLSIAKQSILITSHCYSQFCYLIPIPYSRQAIPIPAHLHFPYVIQIWIVEHSIFGVNTAATILTMTRRRCHVNNQVMLFHIVR